MKRPDLIILVALWEFIGAFFAFIGLLGLAVFSLFPIRSSDLGTGASAYYILTLLGFLGVVFLTYIGICIAGGIGLLMGKEWGRIVSMAQAVLGLFSFPIGTTAGILILIYLSRQEVKDYFRQKPPIPVLPPENPMSTATTPPKPTDTTSP